MKFSDVTFVTFYAVTFSKSGTDPFKTIRYHNSLLYTKKLQHKKLVCFSLSIKKKKNRTRVSYMLRQCSFSNRSLWHKFFNFLSNIFGIIDHNLAFQRHRLNSTTLLLHSTCRIEKIKFQSYNRYLYWLLIGFIIWKCRFDFYFHSIRNCSS